jgi:hypothetical protein
VDRDKGGVDLTAPNFPRLLEQMVDLALKTRVKTRRLLRILNLHVGYATKSTQPINVMN